MATHKHIRSSTANKRPTTAIADGQIALNTNAASPGLFFKDSTGALIIKIGPVHIGSTAPNATPGAGGSSGNSSGEVWLDNSLSPVGVKIWDGSAWVNATPAGSTTVQGLLELATNAETQTGSDTTRAVTPAGLQSKVSDSTSTTSATTIASSTAVKAAYDLAAAALPLTGGIITGNLEIGTTGSLSFEGSAADAFETTITVTNPTADRTITLPDATGTLVLTNAGQTVLSGVLGVGDTSPAVNALRASFRGPVSPTESALPVVSIVRTNNVAGGTGVPETALDVQVPNTFNNAGEVKGINVYATHNVNGTTYGIFAEAAGNPSASNRYSGYFKITQGDTNGPAINYAVYAQANATIGASNSGYSIGVTSETSNYLNNQNFRAVSLYTGASTQTVLSIIRNSSTIGSITTSTTATAYNTSSDYRLKENVVPLTGAIDRLQQIPVHRFNFIADPDRTVDGFIAHEAQAVVPECVAGEKDEVDNEGNPIYQGIDQSKLVPLLTAALQEAIARIETLEARLTAAGIE